MVNKRSKRNKEKLLSTPEAAEILGISRVAVYKRIKRGDLRAEKVGRNYVIARSALGVSAGGSLTESQRFQIEKAVKQTVREYGEALKLLGKE